MYQYNDLSDNELAGLLNTGDHFAYTEIYKRYWPLMFRHARKMLRDDDEATDIVQEIFLTLWSKFDIQYKTSISSYLYTATRNKVIDSINRNKLKNLYLDSLNNLIDRGELITDNAILEKELTERIEKEIASLPKKMRQIFELSRKRNLSHKEIADITSLTEGTVKKQIY